MLASDLSGFPGIGGGSAGFSRNDWIVSSSLTCMIPNALDSARGISRQPTVTSARCSTIPVGFGDALTGRQDIEALVSLRTKEVPAHLQMADEAVSLVLRRHGDTANAGIHRVGQRKIDDARLSAEIDRGFGSPVGQFQQPTAASSCEYISERVACERLGSDGSHFESSSLRCNTSVRSFRAAVPSPTLNRCGHGYNWKARPRTIRSCPSIGA